MVLKKYLFNYKIRNENYRFPILNVNLNSKVLGGDKDGGGIGRGDHFLCYKIIERTIER